MLTESYSSPTRLPYRFSRLGATLVTVLHHVIAISPTLPMLIVYLLSWRVQAIIGHWPVAEIEDPFVGPRDFLVFVLYWSVPFFALLSIFSVVLFPTLTWFRRRHYATWWTILLVIIYLLSWLLARYDPAMRWDWYVD